jgi:hypothetical protein
MMLSQDPILLSLPGYLILYKTKAVFIRLFSVLSLSQLFRIQVTNKSCIKKVSGKNRMLLLQTAGVYVCCVFVAMHIKCCCQTI